MKTSKTENRFSTTEIRLSKISGINNPKLKFLNGPVKCDITATSGTRDWLQTKQTASSYKTERDIFAYISAKIKKKTSIYFAADCNHRCLRERCRIFRFPAAEKEFKTWEKACRRVTFRSIAAYMNGLKCQV